jgi:hypothetical protein
MRRLLAARRVQHRFAIFRLSPDIAELCVSCNAAEFEPAFWLTDPGDEVNLRTASQSAMRVLQCPARDPNRGSGAFVHHKGEPMRNPSHGIPYGRHATRSEVRREWLPVMRMTAFACLSGLTTPMALAAGAEETALTIYSSAQPGAIPPELYRPIPGGGAPNARAVPGYAVVRQDRDVKLDRGRSTLKFTDVAALIDPTTVTFTSLTDPQTHIVEQNYQFDLVSTDKLLLKYIDRPITVERNALGQTVTLSGTLLSSSEGLVLSDKDGSIHALRDYAALSFPELPGGLDTKPTLVWDVLAPKGGSQRARVTYQTGGITWWADYNFVVNEGKDAASGLLDLSAWVSIINMSGAAYPDAVLKLIAGDVNRLPPGGVPSLRKAPMEVAAAAAEAPPGFAEKAFFEFHLYTLGRRTTLPNNSTKQIELFEQARNVPFKKQLVYYGMAGPAYGRPSPITDREPGTPSNKKVDVYLELVNESRYGLGMPLPAGRIRVSKLDPADGSLEFIGEDRIDHTPKGEKIRTRLGSAFDVVGERRQLDFAADVKARWMEEEVEVRLRNHKDQPVDVLVKETLWRWSNWTIVKKSQDFQKEDSHTVQFPVSVPKDGESVLTYRVRYTW